MRIKTKKKFLSSVVCGVMFCITIAIVFFAPTSKTRNDDFVFDNGVNSGNNVGIENTSESFSVGENSSAYYGSHRHTPNTNGLVVSLKSKEEFRYNKVINLADNRYSENLLSLYIAPSVIGSHDFSRLNIKLTDAYDASKYVIVSANRYYYENYASYFSARGENQELTGLDPGPGNIFVGGGFGQYNFFSFSGTPYTGKTTKIEDDIMDLRFDYQNSIVYSIRHNDPHWDFVIDLDDEKYFEEKWNGFTTGEVFLSIYADDYAGEKAEFVIKSIDGMDISELTFADLGSPRITVDYADYTQETIPRALVGNPYKIFDASAYDVYCGNVAITNEVIFNSKKVAIDDKNYFVADSVGEYTIKYLSTDKNGNTAEKEIVVNAVASTPDVTLTVEKNNAIKFGYVGESIAVATSSALGGEGKVKISVEAFIEGDLPIKITENKFKPLKKGNYKIKYTACDYTSKSVTDEYNLSVGYKSKPIFSDEVDMPQTFISGKSYTMPTLFASDYYINQGQENKIKAKVSYIDSYGLAQADNDVITPIATSDGFVKVIYTAETSAGVETKEYKVPIIVSINAAGKLDLKKFFIYDNVKATLNPNDILFLTERNGGKVRFINDIYAASFKMQFNIDKNNQNFSKMNIYLTDSVDFSEKVKFSFIKNVSDTSKTFVSINDGKKYPTAGAFDGSSSYDFNLSYNNESKTFSDNFSTTLIVKKNSKGDAFNGFESGSVYVDIEFEDVSGLSGIKLMSMCSQVFGQYYSDTIAPQVIIDGEYGGQYSLNTVVDLPRVYGKDVLDPNVQTLMTVKDSEGKVVTSVDGYLLSSIDSDRVYQIKLEKYGKYMITFIATDSNNQKNKNTRYMIYCVDDVAPTLKLNGKVPTSAVLGEWITLPKVEVTDNISSKITVHISYTDPMGRVIAVKDNKFLPKSQGVCEVNYMVSDESGNVVMQSYKLSVKAR